MFQAIFDDNGSTMDEKLDGLTKTYNETLDKAIADGSLVAEDCVVADWDPLTWQPPS